MKKYLLALTLFALVTAVHAQGKTERFYLGAGLGTGSTKYSNYVCIASSCKDSDGVSRFYLGYQVSPKWAAEFGQTTLAKNDAVNSTGKLTVDPGTATEVSALGRVPFSAEGWGMIFRLGLSSMTSSASGTTTSSKSSISPVIGLGFDYTHASRLGVRFEFDTRSFNAGAAPSGLSGGDLSGTASTFSISANYRF